MSALGILVLLLPWWWALEASDRRHRKHLARAYGRHWHELRRDTCSQWCQRALEAGHDG